jgi:hypothetical protein
MTRPLTKLFHLGSAAKFSSNFYQFTFATDQNSCYISASSLLLKLNLSVFVINYVEISKRKLLKHDKFVKMISHYRQFMQKTLSVWYFILLIVLAVFIVTTFFTFVMYFDTVKTYIHTVTVCGMAQADY